LRKEFLQEYDAQENALKQEFNGNYGRGEFGLDDVFPPLDRFPKLGRPYGVSCVGEPIWPQVPLYGSLIIPLFPTQKDKFESTHGFDPRLVDKLIDFCKETGRIQFALGSDPLLFESAEYLEPILTELKPPRLRGLPLDVIAGKENYARWSTEFDTLGRLKLYSLVKDNWTKAFGVLDAPRYEYAFNTLRKYYIDLRARNLNSIADDVENCLVDDPKRAYVPLALFGMFLAAQSDPLKPIRNFSREDLVNFAKEAEIYGVKGQKITMPCEIGSFLMENLTFLPSGLEACKDLISRFDHRDYYAIMDAINDAVVHKNPDVLRVKSEELSNSLRLVWEDAGGVETKIKAANFLIPVGLGAIDVVTSPFVGVLGALGFLVADKALGATGETLSEKIIRSMVNGSTLAIFDFKRKYGLDRRPLT
jgi:hypothetical protein